MPKGIYIRTSEIRHNKSKVMKLKWQDPKYRAEQSTSLKGRLFSEEGKKNLSQALRKMWEDPEVQAKRSASMKGHLCSEETRAKLSIALTGRTYSEGTIEKMSIASTGRAISKETREKLSTAVSLARQDPECQAKASVITKQLWQDSEYWARQMEARGIKPNQCEQFLISLFQEYSLPFKYVGDGEVILGGKCPDFINTDGKKQLIELFGIYWHPIFDVAKRTEHFRQYGFNTLIIWQDELDDQPRLIIKVKKFMRRK